MFSFIIPLLFLNDEVADSDGTICHTMVDVVEIYDEYTTKYLYVVEANRP